MYVCESECVCILKNFSFPSNKEASDDGDDDCGEIAIEVSVSLSLSFSLF